MKGALLHSRLSILTRHRLLQRMGVSSSSTGTPPPKSLPNMPPPACGQGSISEVSVQTSSPPPPICICSTHSSAHILCDQLCN